MRLEDLFVKLFSMSITAGYVVLAVVLLRLLLRKAPRWISCALWALVGLRLILPFSFESVMSLIPRSATVPPEILHSAQTAISGGIPAANNVVNPAVAGPLTATADSVGAMHSVLSIASAVWLAGMLAMSLYSAITYVRLRRTVDSAVLFRENIYESDRIPSPFVLGLVKPRIYLPFNVGEEDRNYVVAHERTHIQRRDHWIKPLGFLLLTIYWFNPLMWAAYILLCRDIEVACDEAVIQDIGGNEKKAYSLALLNCAVRRRGFAMCPLAFGEVGIKERVKNVLNYRKPAFRIVIAAAVICIVAAVCLLSNPKEKNGTTYENPQAGQLFACRTAYVGDNSAIGNLVGLLKFPADVKYDHIELQTGAEPYGVNVYFSVTPEVKAAYNKSEPENIEVFRVNACMMFSLIENADEVTFRLDDGTENPVDLLFTREWAESLVGADLWAESGSTEELDGLITQIGEHVKSAYTAAESLDDAVSAAFLKESQNGYQEGECAGEGHILLGSVTASGVTKIYALTLYGEYGFENGNFVKVSGTGVIPAVFTFADSDGGLVCTNIEYPEDGSRYGEAIKKLFPSEYQDRVLNPTDSDRQELESQERSYAESYLKQIGRDAVIGDYGDFKHTLLTDVGVSVEVSNGIDDKQFADYPMWIGNREALENGVRYVYEKSYDQEAHEIDFTKYEYGTEKVVERTRLDSLTGEIIETAYHPDKQE